MMSKSASKLYVKEFLLAMGAYVIVLIVSLTLINISASSAWWRIPLALAPIVPIIFAMIACMRLISRVDELLRRIHFEALAFGFASTGILTFSYGLLELIGFPHLRLFLVLPLMVAMWGIGLAIAARRYQ